ncbi:YopX protein [Cruoricaptor ignavus]|uniref:YopX protein n=1 Tax=Cruoricaptor ignavus TaxID=1118202 RepID=A0A1M6GA73_9FLAO|nr:YopX family protein [Cruoricaptor ignavus]SHJ06880.1 YopX protein [Cruoricaptor ignavus]
MKMTNRVFRAYTKECEGLVPIKLYGSLITKKDKAFISFFNPENSLTIREVIPETVSLNTGICDESGMQIFEGDEVLISVPVQNKATVSTKANVVWRRGGFHYLLEKTQTLNSLDSLHPDVKILVIGNIHERYGENH